MKSGKLILISLTVLISMLTLAQTGHAVSEAGVLFLRIASGARAAGMGEAFVAVADDATATHWNPAGLASIGKTEIFAELSHLQFSNDATYVGNLISNSQGFTRLKSIGFAMPLPTSQGSFVIAGGYNRILD